ncbi:hypothetical protein CLU79DRAFT_733041 [Phycomyces nitens]|nr:hypothetical protein CLU79DRAFT_733041 [Phycomyces nitens]
MANTKGLFVFITRTLLAFPIDKFFVFSFSLVNQTQLRYQTLVIKYAFDQSLPLLSLFVLSFWTESNTIVGIIYMQ